MSTERKTVEWASPTDKKIETPTQTASRFRDVVFKEGYSRLKAKFADGKTWLRILPTVKGGAEKGVICQIEEYELGNVKFARPRQSRDVVTDVRCWLYAHDRPAVYSKENPTGAKLWGKPTGLAWVVLPENPEGQRLALLRVSCYDGERGGTPGLGHQIKALSEEVDIEPGSATQGKLLYGDITDPAAGRLVQVTKTQGGEYASYKASIGKSPAPLAEIMALLTDAEIELIKPFEEIVQEPTAEDQIAFLRAYLGDRFPEEALTEKKWAPKAAPAGDDELPM